MIANVWPEHTHLEETISTLKFATRMMKVSNEAIVNIQLDPHLLIKRYEKEVRDLKQELAMHDTLANRGRINYDQYSQDQQKQIAQSTYSYLNGDIEEFQDINSLRMVREIFHQIRYSYRKLKQQVDAIQRQEETDGKKSQEQFATKSSKESKPQEASPEKEPEKQAEEGEEEEQKEETPQKTKRALIDKQFLEYKSEAEDGRKLEQGIIGYRKDMKEKRQLIKNLTAMINGTKAEMDKIRERLDQKQEEKKHQIKDEFGMGEEEQYEEIIDEEELNLLKEMKDMKKHYKETFEKLKALKGDVSDIQLNIDNLKQQLIVSFENWFAEEFEPPQEGAYDESIMIGGAATKTAFKGFEQPAEEEIDSDALAFIRAKKKVDTLHKAKRMERQHR